MNIAIIVFPGSNREHDAAQAIRSVLGVEAFFIWHQETKFSKKMDIIFLPGGFSWGDYLRAGAIAARAPIMKEVGEAVKKGAILCGVCNGFQILLEAGFLPGTLIHNRDLKFIARPVPVMLENTQTAFTRHFQKRQNIVLPIAHHMGNYQIAEEGLARLKGENQIMLRYNQQEGYAGNGSVYDIAGITDKSGRVIGMMPHPENAIFDFHCSRDGAGFFHSLAEAL